MSLASRQKTCPVCSRLFEDGDLFDIEVILEFGRPPHYIAVHWGETTFVRHERKPNDDQ
jgi:hypothetical protein